MLRVPNPLRVMVGCVLVLFSTAARAGLPAGEPRASATASQRLPRAPPLPLEAFLATPRIRSLKLSPDGHRLAWLLDDGNGTSSLWTLRTENLERGKRLHSAQAKQLHWSADSQWLFLESDKHVAGVPVDGGASSVLLTALDERLGQTFAGVDPVLPHHFLLMEKEPGQERHRLLRVDTEGKRQQLYEGERRVLDFVLDPKGALAFIKLPDARHHQVIYRASESGWKEVVRCDALITCGLLATPADRSRLLMQGNLGGNFSRLLSLEVATGAVRTVHEDPERIADLDEVVLEPGTLTPLIASYHAGRQKNHGLNDRMARHVALVERRFPDRAIHMSIGAPSPLWLLTERGARLQRERYHLYDTRSGAITPVLEDERLRSAPLEERALAEKLPIRYRASDGMWLYGFLTLPPGQDATRLPLVVRVHGGPWAQIRNDFNAVTQFLANRGYAVFEPNFRASTGHGLDYVLAARGDFGNGRVQQDIVEGVRHLLAQGIGDRQRVAIIGHSFGGYSTLLGLTFTPDLFRVGIASAPPSDLSWALRWMSEAEAKDAGVPLSARLRALSLGLEDTAAMTRLSAQSPEKHAASMNRPLLLLAGAKDEKVALKSVTHYAARLRALGKDVSLLVDPDAHHGLELPMMQKAYLHLLERMLSRHLGGPAPAEADETLKAYLQRNLLITGEGAKPTR